MSDEELLKQTKNYFSQVRKIDRLIRRLQHSIGKMQSILPNRSGALLPHVDPDECAISQIAELAAMRNEAFLMIGNVPDFDQQNILIARYIQMKDWNDIAEELDFSTKWVFKLHGRGLLAFSKVNQDFLAEWQNSRVKITAGLPTP